MATSFGAFFSSRQVIRVQQQVNHYRVTNVPEPNIRPKRNHVSIQTPWPKATKIPIALLWILFFSGSKNKIVPYSSKLKPNDQNAYRQPFFLVVYHSPLYINTSYPIEVTRAFAVKPRHSSNNDPYSSKSAGEYPEVKLARQGIVVVVVILWLESCRLNPHSTVHVLDGLLYAIVVLPLQNYLARGWVTIAVVGCLIKGQSLHGCAERNSFWHFLFHLCPP